MVVNTKHSSAVWSIAEAKAKFSEVVERAKIDGPQRITKNGHDAVVVVSAVEWDRRDVMKGSIVDFFERSPLRGSGIDLERVRDTPRDVDL